MPVLEQVKALIHHYGPTVYFYFHKVYLPSSVPWFLENLSQNGNDHTFFKHGCLDTAQVNVQVKPANGGIFTNIDIRIFFPFKGPDTSTLKILIMNIDMMDQKTGEHVGHWECFTLRISNFNGQLWRVYVPDHSGTIRLKVDPSCLEFIEGSNKFRHASFPNAGTYIQGKLAKLGMGVTDADGMFIDTSKKYRIIGVKYLGDGVVVEPDWMHKLRLTDGGEKLASASRSSAH